MTSLLKPTYLKPAFYLDTYGALRMLAGVQVNGFSYSSDAVTLPAMVGGEDYKVWVQSDGTPVASHFDLAPADPASTEIGGFHFSPGGLAADVDMGGNTTAQINPYSFWDLKFGPNCDSARGMTKLGNASIWEDIYFLNVSHHALGTSRNNQYIATGARPPERAYDYGGAGTSKYKENLMWNYDEVLAQHGKRPGRYREHCLGAFGVKENIGRGSHPQKTGLATDNVGANAPDHYFTSKWGVLQATGCIWTITETPAPWRGRPGPNVAAAVGTATEFDAWDAFDVTGGATNLEGSRGRAIMQSAYDGAYVMHGGKYSYNIVCGSRGFENIEKMWDASPNFGARGFADHRWER